MTLVETLIPIAYCRHQRFSLDAKEQIGVCLDCGAEGRMMFVVPSTAVGANGDPTHPEMRDPNKNSDLEKLKSIRKRSEISEDNPGCLIYPHADVWLQSLGSSRSIYRAVAMLSGIKILPGEIAFPACGTQRCCADGHVKVMSRKDEAAFQADKISNMRTRVMKFASGKMPATSVFTWTGRA